MSRPSPDLLEALFREAGFAPNPAQREAILHGEGPLFLVAGPGSGKTRVLLWRTVRLIVEEGLEPQQIFLSTFTEKAARQLEDGLVRLLGLASRHTKRPYDTSGMYVGTLHGLCHRLLGDRTLPSDRDRRAPPAVLDALDQYFELASAGFWREALVATSFDGELRAFRQQINGAFGAPHSGARHTAVTHLQGLFNRLAEEGLNPSELIDRAPADHKPLLALGALYRRRLGDRRVDLALLQQAALAHLSERPEVAAAFRHVIIDEYQDTNAIQERLVFALARPHGNLCVVGDDDQALYRFRGATVENFVEFPARCAKHLGRDPRRIALSTNYRSRPGVVAACAALMAQGDWSRGDGGAYRLHDKGIAAHRAEEGPSVYVTDPAHPEELAVEVAQTVQALLKQGKVADPNQIAFLFPSLKSKSVAAYQRALEAVGLQVYAPRARPFLRSPEPTLVIGLLGRVLGRPPRSEEHDHGGYKGFQDWLSEAEDAAKAACKAQPTLQAYLTDRAEELKRLEKDLTALEKVLATEGWSATNLYDPALHKRKLLGPSGISADARRAVGGTSLERLYRERHGTSGALTLLQVLRRATTADWGLLDVFYRLLGFAPLQGWLDLADGGVDEGPICNLAQTSQLLARYVDTFPALITGFGVQSGMLRTGFYQAFLYAVFQLGEGEAEDAEDPFPRGRIPFLTIHQAKGLEFPVVVVGSHRTRRRVRPVEAMVRPFLPPGGEPLERQPDFDALRMYYVAWSRAQELLILAQPRGQGQTIDVEVRAVLGDLPALQTLEVAALPAARAASEDRVRRYSYTADYLAYQQCPRHYLLFRRFDFAPSRTQTMFFGSLIHQTLEDLHQRLIARAATAGGGA